MSGGPFAGQVHGPPRFSGLNCRVQLFNYRVWGPAAAIPGPLHARSKCEYIHTRAHVDAFWSSPPTKRETKSFLPTRNQIRDTSGRFTLRSIRTFHPFSRVYKLCYENILARVYIVFDQVLASVYPLTSHHLTLHPRITLRAPLVARLPTTKLHRGIYHLCSHLGPPSRKPRRC